ncbi:MAG TPA: MgtC/SapB family protein [Stenomitos sp.]
MTAPLPTLLSTDAFKLFLVLFLSFLIGLEREEQKLTKERYVFGGVRTYPLIGLVGFGMAYLSRTQLVPLAIGFAVVGGLMLLSYWHKLTSSQASGATSEVAGLTTYLIGALVYYHHYWVATAFAVASVALLELKSTLEGLTQRFSPVDILTLTQFLFLTIVILPILPNQPYGAFEINPFKTWLVVVAVSTISYGSFLLQRVYKEKGSVVLVALLGGAYSSTATTVALAKKSVADRRPHCYAGGIAIASGMMYLRIALLVGLFNRTLQQTLVLPLTLLGICGIVGGWVWSKRGDRTPKVEPPPLQTAQNPLELKTALLFAGLFVAMIVITHYTVQNLGDGGVYALAGVMGVTDVDPFILGITQSAGQSTPTDVAQAAILIATSSNNIVKGIYALSFGDRATGRQSLGLLTLLAAIGIVPLLGVLLHLF